MKQVILAILTLILLASCVPPVSQAITPVETTPALTQSSKPIAPSSLTPTLTQIPSSTPTLSPTAPPTQPPSPSPTETLDEWQLTMESVPKYVSATAAPIHKDNEFTNDLIELGYQILDGSSIIGPGGYIYSAYLFVKKNKIDEWECRVAFFRSEGDENYLLYSFPHPFYPDWGRWNNLPPYRCTPIDWNNPLSFYFDYPQDELAYQELNLHGSWSDINQNGLPEYAIFYEFCSNGCWDRGAVVTHFYEIHTTSKVVNLTNNLPGVIEPFHFVHSQNPYNFYVYDARLSHVYCNGCIYRTYWIYGWDGENFIDVSTQYEEEYLARGQEIIRKIQAAYGKSYAEWQLLEILFLYDKANLRKQAIQEFMEISDPVHWPTADQWHTCWLQIARADAQENYRLGRRFWFPPLNLANLFFPAKELSYALDKVDATRYDVSICQNIMKTLTP